MGRIEVLFGNAAFAGLLFLALIGPGRLLVRLLRLRPAAAAERNLSALALGFGAVTLAIYLLGVAGSFGAAGIGAVLLAALLLSLLELPGLLREAGAGLRGARAALGGLSPRRAGTWLGAALALYLLALFARTFLPVVHTDPLAYQLVVPQQWLLEGRIGFLPTHLTSELPAGTWTLYAAAISLRGAYAGAMACQLVEHGFFLAGLAALYLGARRLVPERAARWAAALYATTPAVAWWSVLPYAAASSTFFLILGLDWLVRWVRRPGEGYRPVAMAGVLGGLALWCKVHGGVFAAAAGALVVAGALRAPDRKLRRLAAAGAIYALAVAAVAAPWYLRSWIETGSPVFPMLNGVFGSPHFTTADGPSFGSSLFRSKQLRWALTFPYEFADYSADKQRVIGPVWLPLTLLALFSWRRLSAAARGGLGLALFYSLIMNLGLQGNVRYSQILLAVAAVPAAEALVGAAGRLAGSGRRRLAALPEGLTMGLAVLAVALGFDLRSLPDLRRQAQEMRRAWCRPEAVVDPDRLPPDSDEPTIAQVPGYDVMMAAKRLVPPGDKVLLAGLSKGYYLERRYLRDEAGQTALRFDAPGASAEDVARRLEELGVRWVIWPEKGLQRHVSRRNFGRKLKAYLVKGLRAEFAARCTTVVIKGECASLRRLKIPNEDTR